MAQLSLQQAEALNSSPVFAPALRPLKARAYLLALALASVVLTTAVLWPGDGVLKTSAPNSVFVLLDGSSRSSADFQGRVTLVNFWATSCGSCVAEMPKITATYKAFHARGFDTIAVAMYYDPPSAVVHFTQTRGLPFQVAIDNTGQVARQWGDVAVTPTSFLVDQRGLIIKRYVGEPDFAELNQLIERLLPGA